MKHLSYLIILLLIGEMSGCRRAEENERVTVETLTARLHEPLWLARLDQPDSHLHSSFDPTGGNNDYNHFKRKSKTPGWVVLADLKGPGFVSRLWFTGAKDGAPHHFRFYFDGETSPRLEGNIKELFEGRTAPFLAPLAEYNNYCWYSFIPMPYRKSLRIECEAGAPGGRLFYQISESRLSRQTPVETFTWPLPERDLAAIAKARAVWQENRLPEAGKLDERVITDWSIPIRLEGPGIIRRISFTPIWNDIPEDLRDEVLRDWMVSIRYDGTGNDSVMVPIGDLCGTPWRRIRAQSLFFGMEDDTLFCAFPMPFAESVEIQIKPDRIPEVPMTVRIWTESLATSPIGTMGYFHANWRRTAPADPGGRHTVLSVKGNGKFAGCLLTVVALEGSYWVLESDETIRKDGEKVAGWQGTGLEDYFNGGWYYQNVMAGPTHGLPIKEPFRTVQYRIHAMDPSLFNSALDMAFEKGPERVSKAFFESISWYYLDRPQAADTRSSPKQDRRMPLDPRLDPAVVMTAIWNHERFGDWQGAHDELASRLRRDGDKFPPAARRMLEFRLDLLKEKLGGPSNLELFLSDTESHVQKTARMLHRHRTDGIALAVLYASMHTRLFLNGSQVMEANNPAAPSAALIDLPPGRHVLAIQSVRHRYPDWVQLALRGADWFIGTDPTWKFAFNPSGQWMDPDFDDSNWSSLEGTGVKGPPEEPHIWTEPDPFLDMQSKAVGIRPTLDWPAGANFVVYRKIIVIKK